MIYQIIIHIFALIGASAIGLILFLYFSNRNWEKEFRGYGD